MSISDVETVVCKGSRKFERVFSCAHFGVCVCPQNNTSAERNNRSENGQPGFHFGGSLLSISVISLPTASFTFFTSSWLGALPSGNETSFSIALNCSLTLLTRGS